jgi:hypothetical protein
VGFPGEQEFIKSFREGPKILIAHIGGNKDGRFLEADVFRLAGRKWIVLIPEGREGWGRHKFSSELRKISAFLSDSVGCGRESSAATIIRGASLGRAPLWTRHSLCGDGEVGFGHRGEGDTHRGGSTFHVKGFVGGA